MVLSGKFNPMYGKCSEDFMSPEAIKEKRKKQAEASKRRKWKKSTRIKISQSKIGELNPMYGKPSNKMPHYNKRCMKCLETGKYEYIDKALVDDYLNHGYILEGSNKNIKPSKQSRKLNSLGHIGRKYMIHPITKDRKNP